MRSVMHRSKLLGSKSKMAHQLWSEHTNLGSKCKSTVEATTH
uniref:Uncharacterized protein n=1 Tax=Arundo donax TaxID=35708 RepID=A0A0A9AYY9_ARUDO